MKRLQNNYELEVGKLEGEHSNHTHALSEFSRFPPVPSRFIEDGIVAVVAARPTSCPKMSGPLTALKRHLDS